MNFFQLLNFLAALFCAAVGILVLVTKPIYPVLYGISLSWQFAFFLMLFLYSVNIAIAAKALQKKDSLWREFMHYPKNTHDDFVGFVTEVQRDIIESYRIPSDLIGKETK